MKKSKINMNYGKETALALNLFWIKTKYFRILVENILLNLDLFENNEDYDEIWKSITMTIDDFLGVVSNHSAIIVLMERTDLEKRNKLWDDYDTLIENIVKLKLLRDYRIITKYEEFIRDLCDMLIFFENELKSVCYHYL